MANLRDIRIKIKSVKNIQKITQAMKMVAASKLKKVQDKVSEGRAYSEKMLELVQKVTPYARDAHHPLLDEREIKKVGIVVVTGDKGLCGGYNNAVIRKAVEAIDKSQVPFEVFAIGKKACEYFGKRNYLLKKAELLPPVEAGFADIQHISRFMTDWFESGAVDEVKIAYTKFINVIRQETKVISFLPIRPDRDLAAGVSAESTSDDSASGSDCIFEPEASALLGDLIPRFVENQIFHYLLESLTSEQGARMQAMSQATSNAGELIDNLTQIYNKARQWAITTEMLEIVGGAEALKQVN